MLPAGARRVPPRRGAAHLLEEARGGDALALGVVAAGISQRDDSSVASSLFERLRCTSTTVDTDADGDGPAFLSCPGLVQADCD